MKKILAFLLSFFLFAAAGCTITHFEKRADGGYKASNYSVGMDREAVKIDTADGTSVEIGTSNSSNSGDKINEGLRLIIEGAKAAN